MLEAEDAVLVTFCPLPRKGARFIQWFGIQHLRSNTVEMTSKIRFGFVGKRDSTSMIAPR